MRNGESSGVYKVTLKDSREIFSFEFCWSEQGIARLKEPGNSEKVAN